MGVVPDADLCDLVEHDSDLDFRGGVGSHLNDPSEGSMVCGPDHVRREPVWQDPPEGGREPLLLVHREFVPVDPFLQVAIGPLGGFDRLLHRRLLVFGQLIGNPELDLRRAYISQRLLANGCPDTVPNEFVRTDATYIEEGE